MPDEEFYPEEGLGQGKINISEDVIATIVGLAVTGVDGIVSPKGNPFPKGEGARKLVDTQLTADNASISIKVGVIYGYPIQEVVRTLQEKVKTEVEQMTALAVESVNVEVMQLAFPEEG